MLAVKVLMCTYDRLPVEMVKGSITRALYGMDSRGNELTKTVSQACRAFATQPLGGVRPICLRFRQSAFLALMAAVAKTQSQVPPLGSFPSFPWVFILGL
jgi:hypothetical protein